MFEDDFKLKDWKDVRGLDDGVLGKIVVDRLKELYEKTNLAFNIDLDFNVELEKLHKMLEEITRIKRGTYFYNKYFYFIAQDLEGTCFVNPDQWYMSDEEVEDSINREEYIFEFKRHKNDIDFPPYEAVDDFISSVMDFNYAHSLDGTFNDFKREFNTHYKK